MTTAAVTYLKQSIDFLHGGFRDARSGQSAEQLHFSPDGESHSVAWVLWHTARVEDLLVQGAFQGRQQIWREGGWAERTGLPRKEFGTGQPTDEAKALRITDLDVFWQYADAVYAATDAFLGSFSDADLEREVKVGERDKTLGQSITLHLVTHENGHRPTAWFPPSLHPRSHHRSPPVRPRSSPTPKKPHPRHARPPPVMPNKGG